MALTAQALYRAQGYDSYAVALHRKLPGDT